MRNLHIAESSIIDLIKSARIWSSYRQRALRTIRVLNSVSTNGADISLSLVKRRGKVPVKLMTTKAATPSAAKLADFSSSGARSFNHSEIGYPQNTSWHSANSTVSSPLGQFRIYCTSISDKRIRAHNRHFIVIVQCGYIFTRVVITQGGEIQLV